MLVVILALTLGGVALSTGVAIAIGRVGAAADADLDRLLDQHRRGPAVTILRQSYIGLARAQSVLVREHSITASLPGKSTGRRSPPASSCTSRRLRLPAHTRL
ncbi:MAG: hypothetical protein ACHQCH_01705 [Solirubrobacterales bacterium]